MAELRADMAASVWRVLVAEGDQVTAGQNVVILESMKMEIPVMSPVPGTVTAVPVQEGQNVDGGDILVVVNPE